MTRTGRSGRLEREIADYLREDPLSATLIGPGMNPAIGPETGRPRRDGIAAFKSPHGSVRYLYYVDGEAASGLQVVSADDTRAVIANLYTRPEHRRMALAMKLLDRASRDFVVEHAAESSLSDLGRVWRDGVRQKAARRRMR